MKKTNRSGFWVDGWRYARAAIKSYILGTSAFLAVRNFNGTNHGGNRVMKLFLITTAFLISIFGPESKAQTTQTTDAGSLNTTQGVPAPTTFQVVGNDANSRVLRREVYEQLPSGRVVTHEQSYTELSAGLYYQDPQNPNQWLESKEEIDLQPDGSAAAVQGQHQAFFPPDLYAGTVQMNLPDGQSLRSQPCILAYDDGENTVIIGVLTNSVGQLLGPNEVIYTNAFVGVSADVLYQYKLSGSEQNIVLRAQLPNPASLGLNAATAKLQVWTEFINPPTPTQYTVTDPNENDVTDTTLKFGSTTFGHGSAFLLGNQTDRGNPTDRIPVFKTWLNVQQRAFLIESVPYHAITIQLQALPSSASAGESKRFKFYASLKKSGQYKLPPVHLAAVLNHKARITRANSMADDGLVLDYVTINAAQTNFTFCGDTTYFVSGAYNLEGTTVFEAGSVIKMNGSGELNIPADATIQCKGVPYSPTVFTSYKDNSIGQAVSSGSPAENDVYQFLYFDATNVVVENMRFSYASRALAEHWWGPAGLLDIWNCQFENGDVAAIAYDIGLHNVLIGRTNNPVFSEYPALYLEGQNMIGENVTADGGSSFLETDHSAPVNVALTNSLISGQTFSYSTTYTLVSEDLFTVPSPGVPIYQTVGAGSYYLTNGSYYHGIGTTNVSPALFTNLIAKTTYPPIVYSNMTFSVATNFSPQAQRDGNGALDIGYHFDPLDYVFGGVTANSNMVFAAGTAIGWFQLPGSGGPGYGISLQSGVTATFNGLVTNPCYSVRYDSVQEGGNGYWTDIGWLANLISGGSSAATINAQFTRFAHQGGDPGHFRDYDTWLNVNASHCEMGRDFGGYGLIICLTNCLFDRVNYWQGANSASALVIFRNITWHGGSLGFSHWEGGAPYWYSSVRDCAFDSTPISIDDPFGTNAAYADYNYNAFITSSNQLPAEGTNNVTVTNFNWESSWFGNYYLPTNSPVLQKGDESANLLGLYYFTTQTNQTIEGNAIVDIGYHYVATDQYGNPGPETNNPVGTNLSVTILSPTNQIIQQRTNALITATATNSSPAFPVQLVEFFSGTNYLGYAVSSNGTYQILAPFAVAGTNILTALAVNTNGISAWSPPVTNIVRALPIVTIQAPTNGALFLQSPVNVIIQALAIPNLATVTNVTFYRGTNIIGVATNGPANQFSITNAMSEGTYVLNAKAYDTLGGISFSTNVTVTIETNQPPSAYAGPNQTNNLSTNALQLVGIASDDGLPYGELLINWSNISGPTNVIFTVTNQQITSVYLSATGAYQFVLSASDGQYTTRSTNTITVIPAGLPPVVSAGTNQNIILAAQYTQTNDIVNSTTYGDVKSSKGKEFWLGFPENWLGSQQDISNSLTIFISSETNTVVDVMIPAQDYFTNYNVIAGTVTTVNIPADIEVDTDDQIGTNGIHIIAQNDISVYGLSYLYQSSDVYCGLPITALGTNYIVLGYTPVYNFDCEFLIVGTAKSTTVHFTPTVINDSETRQAGTNYTINLDEGETYQLQSTAGDLSGTVITSDKPIAVFGGNTLAFIPVNYDAGDFIVQQLPPVDSWGRKFLTVPLARTNPGDVFQIVAAADQTIVSIVTNGVSQVLTLNKSCVTNFMLANPSQITSDKPILLAQYATGAYATGAYNNPGDPAMILIPPFEQFLSTYTVAVPVTPTDGQVWTNYVNLVVTNSGSGLIKLDGAVLGSVNFLSISNSGFSYAQIPLAPGSHNLTAPVPFGAFMYGLAWLADAYGYPGGFSLGAIADVNAISLAPNNSTNGVDTTFCLTATVTDQNYQPVTGVRVDFQISGSNSFIGSAYTGEGGQALFAYTGTNLGLDTITASLGTNSVLATNLWTLPFFALAGSVFSDGIPASATNILWSQIGGPPVVGILNPQSLNPVVEATGPGFYSFQLSVNNTVLTNSAQVGITVLRNQPPSVSAGTNQIIQSATVTMNGSVSDDGLPNGTLTTTWSVVSGPGMVTFLNSNQPATTATFSAPGVYDLRLTGNDSQAATYADVTITVLVNPQPVECGQTIFGNLVSTDIHSIQQSNSYADYYEFYGQSNKFLTVTMTSTNFDTFLVIRNQQLQLLAEDDDSFSTTLGPTNSLITYCFPADGVYIIEATSAKATQTGAYQIQFHCGLPATVTITNPPSGTVYPSAPATVNVGAVVANLYNINYVKLDTNGVAVGNFTGIGGVSFSYSLPGAAAGSYSLTAIANGTDGSGNSLSVTSAPVMINVGLPIIVLSPVTVCTGLLPGTNTITGTLENASGSAVTGNVTFTVTGANPTNATITTSGSGVVSFTYAATNAGRDLITATATVGGLPASAAVERDWALPLSCGEYVFGLLTNTSCTSSRSGYADYYSFSGPSNETVAITLSSGNFATYLNIWDTNCDLVVSNGNSDATNSQIIYTLPAAGTYIIEATSDVGQQTGAYLLQFFCNVVTNRAGSPQIAVLQGSQVLSNYATVDFGATTVTNPISLALTITNAGTTPLALEPASVEGDFIVSNWPAAPIPSGGSAIFTVQFNASTNEFQIGQLGFANNAPTGNPFILNLSAVANIPGSAPTVTLTAPTNNPVFQFGTNIVVSANAAASGGYSVSNVQFVAAMGASQFLIGIATNFPYTINWINGNPGYYSLFAVATDSAGRWGYSTPPVNVHILPPNTNLPPVAGTINVTVFAGSQNDVIFPLTNCFDASGNPLTIIGVQPSTLTPSHPVHGIPTIINGGRAISYTPPPGQGYPIDGFSYEISDGHGGTAWGSVFVTAFASASPSVVLTPANYVTNAGAMDPLVASVTPSQYITRVDFYLGDVLIGSVTNGVNGLYTNFWTAEYKDCSCGFTATAYDAFCQIGTSTPIYITVHPPLNGPGGTSSIGPIAAIGDYSAGTNAPQPFTNFTTIRDGIIMLTGQAVHPLGSNDVEWSLGVYTYDGQTLLRDLTPKPLVDTDYHAGIIGTTSIYGVLTSNCDLTTLANGSYIMRLTVQGGLMMTNTDVTFLLDSNLKIGQFSFSQQDLVIPVNGIPLTVTRTYNSLNPDQGDFGYSWTYSLADMDVQMDEDRQDVPVGGYTDNSDTDGLDGGDKAQIISVRSGGSRDVTLTLPDGTRTTFAYSLELGGGDAEGSIYNAVWTAPAGVMAKLYTPHAAAGAGDWGDNTVIFPIISDLPPYWVEGPEGNTYDNYDIPGWILEMPDGTKYQITRGDSDVVTYENPPGSGVYQNALVYGSPKLASIAEPNTDTINIGESGITFSATNGATRQIVFQRNAAGLISSISDPSGLTNGPSAVKYEYDSYNNLIYVERLTDRTAGTYVTNSFLYANPNFPHFITSMFNGDGTQVAENFYDDTGKLIAVQDANGTKTQFIHSLTNSTDIVVDQLGNTNTYVYDTRGNVISETDPLGHTTYSSYDANNNLLSTVDPLGNTNSYAYDSFNNRIQSVDPMGRTNSFAYDPNDNLISQTDSLGNSTTNTYDANGDLVETAQYDPLGNLITSSTSSYFGGVLTGTADALGRTTASFTYDPSAGYLTASTDANSFTHNFAYDANGNQTNTSYTWTGPGGSTIVTTTTVFDGQNRVTMTIDADGNTNQTFYNINGKVACTIDRYGNTNSLIYDARGNVIQQNNADGTFTCTVYDAAGRPYLSSDRNQLTGTLTQYDPLGRATNTTRMMGLVINIVPDPLNPGVLTSTVGSLGTGFSTNSTVYMANGWVASRTGPDGQTTTYSYWPDGQAQTVVDALNHTNYYQYDTAGRQALTRDALNHTVQFQYDSVGRLVTTLFNDNSTTTNLYNSLGQRTGEVDQAARVTQFAYDVSGELTNVIKPPVPNPLNGFVTNSAQWSYTYDQYERQTVTTDPLGHTNSIAYDAQGRQLTMRLPLGQIATNVYATSTTTNHLTGQLWRQYDFKGQWTEFQYDHLGRVKAKYFFAANATAPSNSVTYIYDALGRVTETIENVGTNASQGYAYLGGGHSGLGARMMASVISHPETAGGASGLAMFAMAFAILPRALRRQLFGFALMLYHEQCELFAALSSVRIGRRRSLPRLRLPSYGWRFATLITLAAMIANEPGMDHYWNARAGGFTYPSNASTPVTRYTYYSYDFDGHLVQINAPEGVINYAYDLPTGRLIETNTKNSDIQYTYDALGRLQTVKVAMRNGVVLATPEVTTYNYDAVGNRSNVQLPNGITSYYAYDSLNRLTNLVHQIGTSTITNLASYSYKLDQTGRRTNAVEILQQEGGTYQTNTLAWSYDSMYRLTNEVSVSKSLAGGTFAYTNNYVYDLAGNRMQQIKTGSTLTVVTNVYDANDELLREVTKVNGALSDTNSYAYDINGSVTGKTNASGTATYTYDAKNKLSGVLSAGVQANYLYNDQGIRVSQSINGGTTTHYLVDANNMTGYAQVLEELSNLNTTPTTSYVIGDEVLAQCGTTSTAPSYFLMDGHGNNRQLGSISGFVSSHFGYDAYGTVQGGMSTCSAETAVNTEVTSKLYSGEQYDSNLQMYNLRARYYCPANGRFNQRDSFAGNNDDPQSLHKYLYCSADPIDMHDPTGRQGALLEVMAGIALIAIIGISLGIAYRGTIGYIAEVDVYILPYAGAHADLAADYRRRILKQSSGIEAQFGHVVTTRIHDGALPAGVHPGYSLATKTYTVTTEFSEAPNEIGYTRGAEIQLNHFLLHEEIAEINAAQPGRDFDESKLEFVSANAFMHELVHAIYHHASFRSGSEHEGEGLMSGWPWGTFSFYAADHGLIPFSQETTHKLNAACGYRR